MHCVGVDPGAVSWAGCRLVYDCRGCTRLVDEVDKSNSARLPSARDADSGIAYGCAGAAKLLRLFQERGCTMVRMDAEAHDLAAAKTQFLTHFLSRCVVFAIVD